MDIQNQVNNVMVRRFRFLVHFKSLYPYNASLWARSRLYGNLVTALVGTNMSATASHCRPSSVSCQYTT